MQQGSINSRNTLFGQLLTNQYKRPTTMKAEFHNAVFFIPWGRRKAGEVTYQWGPIPVSLWAAPCCPHRQRVEVGAMGTTSCRATGAGPAPPELTQQPNDRRAEHKQRTIDRKERTFFKKWHFTNTIFILYMKATACSNSGAYDSCFTKSSQMKHEHR